jgi:C4-dicarboxylate-specific signal transduction histidine kinase
VIAQSGISDWGWADYGLSGLVIAGLLALVWHVTRLHRDERSEWRSESREERKETRESVERHMDKLDHTIQMFERTIHDRHKKEG